MAPAHVRRKGALTYMQSRKRRCFLIEAAIVAPCKYHNICFREPDVHTGCCLASACAYWAALGAAVQKESEPGRHTQIAMLVPLILLCVAASILYTIQSQNDIPYIIMLDITYIDCI